MARPVLLVIEDGDEYERFVRTFLKERCELLHADSGALALRLLDQHRVDALLLDLRFERSSAGSLLGDVGDTARRLFAGDRVRALAYLKDQQGTLVLAALRQAGHHQPAVFVHDFPPRRLANLRGLYGEVAAVPTFDAALLSQALGV